MTRRLRASWLIDGTGAPPIEDALVVWDEGGRIIYAGRAGEAPQLTGTTDGSGESGESAETIEATGCTVLPGLIDTHVHLTFAAAAGAGCPPRSAGPAVTAAQVALICGDSDSERIVRALAAAQAALAVGVTTMCDCGDKGSSVLSLRELVEAGVVAGPRILSSGPPITTRAGHCWWLGGEADTLDEAVTRVRELVKLGADFVKVMATGGNLTKGSNPLEPQYPVETLAAIVADSHRLGRRVVAHAHGVEGIARAVVAGVDAVEHCSWQRRDGHAVDEALAARMAAAGTVVGDTLAGFGAVLLREGVAPHDV
ncbi:MAG TPA: amidohydrolase family protein, partial [Chloroflexota bacterium]|nr:amidohydrolase family protein [Chloroflexota bacterium]